MRGRAVVSLTAVAWLATTLSAGAAMTTEQRLRALEDLVREQQQEIKQLRGELRQQKAIGTATQQQAERAEEQSKATEKTTKAALPEWVNKFTPFGDLRIRHETFANQPTPKGGGTVIHARNRERYRWRLGVKYAYSDQLSATIRLASGNPDDPISTNETLDGNFSRKNVNLDWAYLTVSPIRTRPGLVTINAGKFPNTMFRVGEMVFDDDLSPEGANVTIQPLREPVGALDQLKVHVHAWTFKEVANDQDGWMVGGQLNPTAHVGDVQLEGGIAHYWWLNADYIAQAANTNSVIRGVTTNLVERSTDGRTITGFVGAFNQTNATVAATIPNAAGAMPLKLFADYVYNWDAPDSQAHGAMGGVRLGNPKERNDWAVSLLYEYLQRDAVIGAFTWSDFGVPGGTNLQGPVIALDYQALKPLTITARTYFAKYVLAPEDVNNRMGVRFQLDALLKF